MLRASHIPCLPRERVIQAGRGAQDYANYPLALARRSLLEEEKRESMESIRCVVIGAPYAWSARACYCREFEEIYEKRVRFQGGFRSSHETFMKVSCLGSVWELVAVMTRLQRLAACACAGF